MRGVPWSVLAVLETWITAMGAELVCISHDTMQDEDIKFCQFGSLAGDFFNLFSQVGKCDQ